LLPRAARDLEQLNSQDATRIVEGIKLYAQTGHGDVKKLQGMKDVWRLRVGDWRIFFGYDRPRHMIGIESILPRGRAYRVREELTGFGGTEIDSERLSAEESAAIQEGYGDLTAGRVVTHREMRREFGW
jgi:mRNA interferase RelE/StbE